MRNGVWLGLVPLLLIGCAKEGGFVDAGVPTVRDVGFTMPADTGVVTPPRDAGVVDEDGSVIPPADTGVPPVDAGPPEDSGVAGATFTERAIDDNIVHGQGVEVVDIDGDQDLDLVASLSLTDAVLLYVNDGNGNFTRASVGRDIVAMETAAMDVDGDRDLDLVAVGLFDRSVGVFNNPGEVRWFENPGDPTGSWTSHVVTNSLWGALFVEGGDLTGDGRDDAVYGAITLADNGGNPQGSGLYWSRNNGGDLVPPVAIDASLSEVYAVIVTDVDGDGPLDIIAVGGGSGEIAWYENLREGIEDNPSFDKHVIAQVTAPSDIRLANLDDDPALELVATLGNGAGSIAWFDPPEDPSQAWAQTSISEDYGAGLANRLYVGDLNGDQRADIALGAAEFTFIRVFFQDGDGNFVPQLVVDGYTGLNWLAGADVNGDGRTDLVTHTYERISGADRLAWWINQP